MLDAFTFQAEAMRLEKLMYHISWSILRNNEDCADAVQETLARAWQKRATLRSTDQFKPWLMRILVNQCNDILRRQKKSSFFPLEEAGAVSAPPQGPMPLEEAIEALKPDLRIVIVLHYLEGCTVEDMAHILRTPSGTVKSRLRHARQRLGVLLQEEWKEGQV